MSERDDLVDDLADVLSHVVVGWKEQTGIDLAEHPEVQRVFKRYRDSKEEGHRVADDDQATALSMVKNMVDSGQLTEADGRRAMPLDDQVKP